MDDSDWIYTGDKSDNFKILLFIEEKKIVLQFGLMINQTERLDILILLTNQLKSFIDLIWIRTIMKKLFKEKMNEGFSLVELVMVMVILGILSAVAVPKMSNVKHSTVRAEKTVVDQIWSGCEQYAGDKLLEEGTESWPYHPLSTFGRTRNMNINLVLGIPDEDDEWQYNIESDAGEGRVYHFRIDDEIYYYTYDSTTFELAEEPIRYIAQ